MRNTDGIAGLKGRVSVLERRMDGMEYMTKNYAYSAAAMGLAAAGIIFDPRLDSQVGIAGSTVNGKSAMAVGLAVRQARAVINMKSLVQLQ